MECKKLAIKVLSAETMDFEKGICIINRDGEYKSDPVGPETYHASCNIPSGNKPLCSSYEPKTKA